MTDDDPNARLVVGRMRAEKLRLFGTGRDAHNEKALCFYFNRTVTGDELRYLDGVMKRAAACNPIARRSAEVVKFPKP